MYQDLVEMEKKLDWTIMRKKAEVQDALGRTASVRNAFLSLDHVREVVSQVTRTLRLFLSHTVSGQAWQSGETSTPSTADPPNFETGQGIPAWQLKIEARLLEVSPRNERPLVQLVIHTHAASESASQRQDSPTAVLHADQDHGR
jgi:SWI/SNF-related matrix-associated actin-dependent regulator of chromatin subfamily D